MKLLIGGKKDGTGKSTIAVNLATMKAATGESLVILDTNDPTPTAYEWGQVRAELDNVPKVDVHWSDGDVSEEIENLARVYDHVIIDAGGEDCTELRSAMTVADKFYTPVKAEEYDFAHMGRLNDLVGKAKEFNKNLKAYVFINQAEARPGVGETEEVITFITTLFNFQASRTIRARASYMKSLAVGLGVHEMTGRDYNPAAVSELTELYEEIFGVFEKTGKQTFIESPQEDTKYPWETAFVRANSELTKAFSITIPLETFLKIEYIQGYRRERSRNKVIVDFLHHAVEKEIELIKKR